MTALLAERAAEVVSAAQQLLTKRMGAPVKLSDPIELSGSGRTTVLRVRVAENAFSLPRTLIIKQVRGAAQDRRTGGLAPGVASIDSAFLREAVSYQFTTALSREHRPGAYLIAHSLPDRLLILSDLGENSLLTAVLRSGTETAARNALMAFAQALGRMHAATVGREADFVALLRRVDVVHRVDGIAQQAESAIAEVPGLLQRELGIEVPGEIAERIVRGNRLYSAGRFRAFSPSDLCPDNVILNEEGARFLDYEWGGFRDATLDIAYALVSFPGCLCDVELSRERAKQMVEAWRAEVVGVWPALADDEQLDERILEARLIWVWLSTYWFLPADHTRIAAAREHGLSVPRSAALINRWAALAEDARCTGDDIVGDFAEDVSAMLEERWSE
ncbi:MULTISPECIES: phosphotransferase family protein [Nocardia]|uniref:Kinase n=1 Tax=Nocardia abscessus TaxID=120957 RepID=A0ABS0C4I4_9NOCA|nr:MULTISPECIES: kinase [Nocardia]MBF6217521.1 kinase [Nocardia abscessus]MBF6225301.1 kinase [Nocardia abscessus]MBF6470441.1 kinase [Nocardia abscessus]MCC3330202.1 kinase [Nocardia abscessus]MDE1669706.1 kinase [Nocardia gipuzkoensis]